jgi:hypothetical protein
MEIAAVLDMKVLMKLYETLSFAERVAHNGASFRVKGGSRRIGRSTVVTPWR